MKSRPIKKNIRCTDNRIATDSVQNIVTVDSKCIFVITVFISITVQLNCYRYSHVVEPGALFSTLIIFDAFSGFNAWTVSEFRRR